MQSNTFGIVSYEILLNLFDRKGTIEINWIWVIVRRVDNTTLVRQSGAHLSFRFARLQRLRKQIQSRYITDIERTTIRWYNISWNWSFRKKFGWNVILIIAIRKIVNSREWHFGFYVCRTLAFRDFITSRFRHLGGLTSSQIERTSRTKKVRARAALSSTRRHFINNRPIRAKLREKLPHCLRNKKP